MFRGLKLSSVRRGTESWKRGISPCRGWDLSCDDSVADLFWIVVNFVMSWLKVNLLVWRASQLASGRSSWGNLNRGRQEIASRINCHRHLRLRTLDLLIDKRILHFLIRPLTFPLFPGVDNWCPETMAQHPPSVSPLRFIVGLFVLFLLITSLLLYDIAVCITSPVYFLWFSWFTCRSTSLSLVSHMISTPGWRDGSGLLFNIFSSYSPSLYLGRSFNG